MVGMILLIFLVLIESNLCEKYETITEGVFNDHNEHRRAWIVPEFYLNDELNQDSIDYAEHLASLNIPDQKLYEDVDLEKKTGFVDHLDYPHSEEANLNYTENICEFIKNNCVAHWSVDGAKCFGIPKKQRIKVEQSLADKFSAITWRSSTNIGIGWALKNRKKPEGRKILVVRYSPPGNQPGEYESNIENTEFIEYYNMPFMTEPDVRASPNSSRRTRDNIFGKKMFTTSFVLIMFLSLNMQSRPAFSSKI